MMKMEYKTKNDFLSNTSALDINSKKFLGYRAFISEINLFLDTTIVNQNCRNKINNNGFPLHEYGLQIVKHCLYLLINKNLGLEEPQYLIDKINNLFSFLCDYELNFLKQGGKENFMTSDQFWPIEILYLYIGQVIDYLGYNNFWDNDLKKIKETRNKLIIHDIEKTRYVRTDVSAINDGDIYFEYALQVTLESGDKFLLFISPLNDFKTLLCKLIKFLDK